MKTVLMILYNRVSSSYRYAVILILCTACLFSILVLGINSAEGAENAEAKYAGLREILLIHSYHRGMMWTDNMVRGIEEGLDVEKNGIDLRIEYMDTMRYPTGNHVKWLVPLFRNKYKNTKFESIIVSDENALDFILRYGNELFPGIPIIFCGIHHNDPNRLRGRNNITGVVEAYNAVKTLETALKLHPDTERIYIINDKTIVGKSTHNSLMKILPAIRTKAKYEFLDDYTMEELEDRLKSLPNKSVVLMISFIKDRKGRFYRYRDSMNRISSSCERPIYGIQGFYLGRGIVGGCLIDGFEHGKVAASLALKVMKGQKASSIPIVTDSPNFFMFDWNKMVAFGILENDLPKGSIIFNKPRTLYQRYRYHIFIAVMVFLFQGGLIVYLVTNIQERREAEYALRDSEETHRATLDSIGDAVIATNKSGLVVRMNPIAESLTGWTMNEAYNRPLSDVFNIINLQTRMKVENPVDKVLRVGSVVRLANHTILISRDGRELHIADSGAPIRNEEGEIIGVVLVFRDITEQYGIEEQLRQTEKMNAIGHLAGGIAHDFNNMLSGIMGSAELLKMVVANKREIAKHVDSILTTSERAADLVSKLLAFARKGKAMSTPIDMHEYIESATEILKRSLDRKITINIDCSAEHSTVIGDPSLLQNVILNLGLNARDAMPYGGNLLIATKNVEFDEYFCKSSSFELHAGTYIEIIVKDNGTGMDVATMSKIFEPFFTTKGPGHGTGLGLSAVYGTIKEHQGAIIVESKSGEGTSFYIYLPVEKDILPQPVDLEEEPVTGNGCILVVDDEEVIRTMLKSILETLGYDVVMASNGEEALEQYKINAGHINAVLLDMVMPKMDGRKCFHKLKEMDPDVKVILSTGYVKGAYIEDPDLVGIWGFVTKPYRLAELSRVLADAVKVPGDCAGEDIST